MTLFAIALLRGILQCKGMSFSRFCTADLCQLHFSYVCDVGSLERKMPIVIVVANQKGGCGKTTVSMNVAGALAREGITRSSSSMQIRKRRRCSGARTVRRVRCHSMCSRFLIRCCTRRLANWRPLMTSFLLIARREAGAIQVRGYYS